MNNQQCRNRPGLSEQKKIRDEEPAMNIASGKRMHGGYVAEKVVTILALVDQSPATTN